MNDVRKMREELIQLLRLIDESKIDSKVFAHEANRFKRSLIQKGKENGYSESHTDSPGHTQIHDKDGGYDKDWSEDWSDSDPGSGHPHDKQHDKDGPYDKSWSDSTN